MSDAVAQLLDRGRKHKKVKLNAYHWYSEDASVGTELERYVYSFKSLAKYARLDTTAKAAAWYLLDHVTKELGKNATDKENRDSTSLNAVLFLPEFSS